MGDKIYRICDTHLQVIPAKTRPRAIGPSKVTVASKNAVRIWKAFSSPLFVTFKQPSHGPTHRFADVHVCALLWKPRAMAANRRL